MVLACQTADRTESESATEPLVIEDVALPVDAMLSTEEDTKDKTPRARVAGMLPGDFPADLPLPPPSSVVDYSGDGAPARFVVLESPVSQSVLADAFENRLRASGWQLRQDGSTWAVERQGYGATIQLTAHGEGTQIRVEYR